MKTTPTIEPTPHDDQTISDDEKAIAAHIARVQAKLAAIYLEEVAGTMKREHVLHAFAESLGAFMIEAIGNDPTMRLRCARLTSLLALCVTPGHSC